MQLFIMMFSFRVPNFWIFELKHIQNATIHFLLAQNQSSITPSKLHVASSVMQAL